MSEGGGKTGSGPMADRSRENIDRRERLRKLALENIDLQKDPYCMRNHVGTYECKLCLTLHSNEGNYLAHTQGKKHQQNLGRRAAREAREANNGPVGGIAKKQRHVVKIGRPGYKVTKQRDATGQYALLFQVEYPEIESGLQPRHRFMSSYEQRVETVDRNYQYLLVAADPYETIGFKIPNWKIDKGEGKFYTSWDREKLVFTLQVFFLDQQAANEGPPPMM